MEKVYGIITDRIIKLLEQGTVPWHRQWGNPDELPRNLNSGKTYRGINAFLLSAAGYQSPWWMTYKQAHERGGYVRIGERGYPCVYWNWFEKENADTQKVEKIPFLRYYTVFNSAQCEKITIPPSEANPEGSYAPIDVCAAVVESMPRVPKIELGRHAAAYSPSIDTVLMSFPESFHSGEGYYATLYHELIHSTGHRSRLARPGITETIYFGSPTYSKEELIAEMGAAFLCGHAGIENTVIDNSAAYISTWLGRLQDDQRLVVQAAAQAQKAADYILDRRDGADSGDGMAEKSYAAIRSE